MSYTIKSQQNINIFFVSDLWLCEMKNEMYCLYSIERYSIDK